MTKENRVGLSANVVRLPARRNEHHAEGFRDLEPDICDLVRAVDLCMLAVIDDNQELTNFAVRDVLTPMARAFKEKYYKLY
jgi:hypothetical protein